MPWEAPFVKVGKGASSGDAVDGCGEKTGQGGSGNLVEKILQQSLAKVPGKELKKTKPRKPVVKKVPKQKPRIDGPVFSKSPIPMKKVKLGGRQKKTTNFMSEDEEDGGLGLDGRLEGGGEEDNLARRPDFLAKLDALMEPSENVVVENEHPWLGESQVAAARASQENDEMGQSAEVDGSEDDPSVSASQDASEDQVDGSMDGPSASASQGGEQEQETPVVQFWRNEDGNYEGFANMHNTDQKNWVAYRTKIVSSGSPSYTVQGAASIVRPNGQKKVRFFADKGLFSVADKAEISIFGDSSELNLKSKLRENQNDLKDHLKPITPTKTVVLQFQLVAAPKPKLKLAHPCDICGKPFAYKEALLSHKRKKHKTVVEQVFQCSFCDYNGAKTKRAHKAHEQRHAIPTLKKPPQHQCEICEKKFFGEKQLAFHIEKWHTEYLCRLACGEKFLNKALERKHFYNKHHRQSSKVPPPCQICGKEFSWMQGLQKHLRKSRCGETLKMQQQEKDKEVGVEGGEESGKVGGEERMNPDPERLEKNDVVGEDSKDDEEVGQGKGKEKEKGRKGRKENEKRGKKRKVEIEGREECYYELIRRNNIKEKEDFLAAMTDL